MLICTLYGTVPVDVLNLFGAAGHRPSVDYFAEISGSRESDRPLRVLLGRVSPALHFQLDIPIELRGGILARLGGLRLRSLTNNFVRRLLLLLC